jgi:hypothetical protein
MTTGFLKRALIVVALALIAVSAWAQEDPETRTPEWLLFSFEQRTRFERLTNPFRLKEIGLEELLPLRTRLRLELGDITDPIRFLVEFQDSRGFFDEDALFLTPRHINENDFLQVQIQLNSGDFLGKGLESRFAAGRFTLDLGKRRLLARNRMRNTTNAFDGLYWSLASPSNWRFHAFVSRPVLIDPEKLDSSRSSRYFWGVYYENKRFPKLLTDVYYLGLHEDERTVTQHEYTTIGGRLYKNPTPGSVDYEIESTWQFGTNTDRNHFAHFQHAELGYVFDSLWDSRLSFHYDYASGDADPEDDTSGRFSTLFGARRFEHNPTGIYGPFFRGNLHTPGLRIVLIPLNKIELMASHRAFWLARAKDVWVGSGLQDPTGESGKSLGHNFEVRIRWRPTGFLLVEGGYAHFFKGSFLDRVPGSPRTPDSNYVYFGTEIRAGLLPKPAANERKSGKNPKEKI